MLMKVTRHISSMRQQKLWNSWKEQGKTFIIMIQIKKTIKDKAYNIITMYQLFIVLD